MGPVALVIQTRVADDDVSTYVAWQNRVGQALQNHPGFLGQTVTAPSLPAQTEWIVVQKFNRLEDARAWMQSSELHSFLVEISNLFLGHDDVFLCTDIPAKKPPVSATVSCKVAPADVEDFLQWEGKLFRAEVKEEGFASHQLNRPIPGIQENWAIVISFDSDDNLTRWLESPARAALLDEGKKYLGEMRISRSNFGFSMWVREPESSPPARMWVFKSNLVVLAALYPLVYLWGYLASEPLLDSKGAPLWFSLFIGNVVSTQLLGWWVAGWMMKLFDPWLAPRPRRSLEIAGWVILLLMYVGEMLLFKYILSLPRLSSL